MPENKKNSAGTNNKKANLMGTFAGVFTPSFLTIIGIIFFMRLGYVVGNAGLGRALAIILIANCISILTSLSMAAVATNIRVKGGGVYYIISRTLGAQYGGAIGIVMYLAQAVSVAFYCIGFGEVLASLFPNAPALLPQIIAAAALSILFWLALKGADWATRFQYLVMGVLVCAIISFFAGAALQWQPQALRQNWSSFSGAPNFWILFAIFFPAVTGFTQGVNMSGDLRNATKSIPLGTFVAIGLTLVLYCAAAVLFAGGVPQEVMATDYTAMKRLSLFGFLVDAGVIAATLSSAMASFLGAPRVLQALAADRIFPWLLPFAKGEPVTNNPRRGVVLTAIIAFITVALGDLNVIAPVVAMFFLVTYGLLNYATYIEARSKSTSFRPRLRFYNQYFSLAGFIGCGSVMLAINLTAGIISVIIIMAIYVYLERTAKSVRWADSRRSYYLQQVRNNLIATAAEPEHPRNWRPQLLVFSDDPTRRERLLRFASWVNGGVGITTAVRLIEGNGLKALKERKEAEAELRQDITRNKLEAFPLVISSPDVDTAYAALLQAYGTGPLKANVVMVNWMKEMSQGIAAIRQLRYGRNMLTAQRLGCNLVIFDCNESEWIAVCSTPSAQRRIDVVWQGDATSRLMLLLAYLMQRSRDWDGATIRILADGNEEQHPDAREQIEEMLADIRIDAEVVLIQNFDNAALAHTCRDASLVMVAFRLINKRVSTVDGGAIESILQGLPVTALVLAAEDINLEAEPEEGEAVEAAHMVDASDDAAKKANDVRKAADSARSEADKKNATLEQAKDKGLKEDTINALSRSAKQAEGEAVQTERKAAKADAKAELAAREAQESTPNGTNGVSSTEKDSADTSTNDMV